MLSAEKAASSAHLLRLSFSLFVATRNKKRRARIEKRKLDWIIQQFFILSVLLPNGRKINDCRRRNKTQTKQRKTHFEWRFESCLNCFEARKVKDSKSASLFRFFLQNWLGKKLGFALDEIGATLECANLTRERKIRRIGCLQTVSVELVCIEARQTLKIDFLPRTTNETQASGEQTIADCATVALAEMKALCSDLRFSLQLRQTKIADSIRELKLSFPQTNTQIEPPQNKAFRAQTEFAFDFAASVRNKAANFGLQQATSNLQIDAKATTKRKLRRETL